MYKRTTPGRRRALQLKTSNAGYNTHRALTNQDSKIEVLVLIVHVCGENLTDFT